MDIENNSIDPIVKEALNSLAGESGDKVICINCKSEYERGVWNFYNLCDACFSKYNKVKLTQSLEDWLNDENA